VLGGVLVDIVDGDLEVLYRRHHSAVWLRVVPLDGALGDLQDEPDNLDACARYEISIEPMA
jgi:hypothetical protein